ncbi:MAG: polymer-forming cytoskeletal protein [Gammaproteobacteria bacterium]|nr:polymer-forming cytoskeletal protein [Gammaproteobacteria bacterium]MCF6260787.1 polymer-forming cytoskeletal protein [Gammaproteobacteria bacterium]
MASEDPKIHLTNNKGRRSLDSVAGFTTSIGLESIFTGTIGGRGHTIVLGRVEGSSELDGALVIGEGGCWVGDITAKYVVIAGQVEGSITAREKMEIVCTAKIRGSLTSPFIAIAEGAVHEGEIHMAKVKRFTDQRDRD